MYRHGKYFKQGFNVADLPLFFLNRAGFFFLMLFLVYCMFKIGGY